MPRTRKIIEYIIYTLFAAAVLIPLIGALILIAIGIVFGASFAFILAFTNIVPTLLVEILRGEFFYTVYVYHAILLLAPIHVALYAREKDLAKAFVHPTAVIAYIILIILIQL